jgi:1-phosphatidylinositol phosphodiesterase
MASYNSLSLTRRRDAFVLCILGAGLLLCIIWLLNLIPSGLPLPFSRIRPQENPLAVLALQKVLHDASPIFGTYTPNASPPSTSTWMKSYPDSTLLVHMNLPGTHDSATWNYTSSTQDSLSYASKLGSFHPSDPTFYRCHSHSIAATLEAGMRVFDLRYAYDITRTQLVFWHGDALQSQTATVEDVLFGFYHWLDHHPSEAIILSFQHESKTNDAGTQMALYEALTSPAAKKYLVQTRGALGTLGEARGKITLFRRFDLDLLPAEYEESLPGLHFSPKKWTGKSRFSPTSPQRSLN